MQCFVTTVALLRYVGNPMMYPPWGEECDVSRESVTFFLQTRQLEERPYQTLDAEPPSDYHAKRIAYLVANKSDDPIDLDVGIPVLNYYPSEPLMDGNHRFAAAVYRKDLWVLAAISGQDSEIDRVFLLRRRLAPESKT